MFDFLAIIAQPTDRISGTEIAVTGNIHFGVPQSNVEGTKPHERQALPGGRFGEFGKANID